MNQPPSKSKKIHKIDTKHKLLLVMLVLLAIIMSIYIYFDILARDAFGAIQTDMNEIEQTTITPAGGVFQNSSSLGVNALERATSCYLMTCPSITTSWVVPIAEGEDDGLIRRLLNNAGYGVDSEDACSMKSTDNISKGIFPRCIYFGYKTNDQSKNRIIVDDQLADGYQDKIPADRDIAGKGWRRITITIDGR